MTNIQNYISRFGKLCRTFSQMVEEFHHVVFGGFGIDILREGLKSRLNLNETITPNDNIGDYEPSGFFKELRHDISPIKIGLLYKSGWTKGVAKGEDSYKVSLEEGRCIIISSHMVYPYDPDSKGGYVWPYNYDPQKWGIAYNHLLNWRVFDDSNINDFALQLKDNGFKVKRGFSYEHNSPYLEKIAEEDIKKNLPVLTHFLWSIDLYETLRELNPEAMFNTASFDSGYPKRDIKFTNDRTLKNLEYLFLVGFNTPELCSG